MNPPTRWQGPRPQSLPELPSGQWTAPQWSVVLGRCDDMQARVYVKVKGLAAQQPCENLRIVGTLVGPQCRRATTLPITVQLTTMGRKSEKSTVTPEFDPVAVAILTEPSYWTPELPNLYQLDAQLLDGDRIIRTVCSTVGLRRLGVRGRSFWLEGRSYVPRGILASDSAPTATGLAVITNPTPEVVSAADQSGLAIAAGLLEDFSSGGLISTFYDAQVACVAAWANHPAVLFGVLPLQIQSSALNRIATHIRGLKGTMLVGMEVLGTHVPPTDLPVGIDFLVVRLPANGLPDKQWHEHAPPVPLVALRPLACGRDLKSGAESKNNSEERRQSCDQLQATLAAWGLAAGGDRPWDWAGYFVV